MARDFNGLVRGNSEDYEDQTEVMVMELETRKEGGFLSFVQPQTWQ